MGASVDLEGGGGRLPAPGGAAVRTALRELSASRYPERPEAVAGRERSAAPLAFALMLAGAVSAAVILGRPHLTTEVWPRVVPDAVAMLVAAVLLLPRTVRLRARFWLCGITGTITATVGTYLALVPLRGSGSVTSDVVVLGVAIGLIAVLLIKWLVEELRFRVAQLATLAGTDQLTGLANRRAWDDELQRELLRARRDSSPLCIAVLDLDHFKAFNDMRGHQEGDRLLTATAAAWVEVLRGGDFLARYGGEEFAAVFRRCTLDDALIAVERLRMAVPDEQTCSVGLARWDGEETADRLVARADEALYRAKVGGRNRVKCAEWVTETGGRLGVTNWAALVPKIIAGEGVVSAYQPIVDLGSGTVVAHEALARPGVEYDGSVDGLFTAAHKMGMGGDLDWLCRRAALVGSEWIPQGVPLFINVNVSTLLDTNLRVDHMLLLLEGYSGRRPEEVVLEITEREVFSDLVRLRLVVGLYRQRGFRFAIDDVGEGHSTLEVLAAVTPEYIKIARPMVVDALSVGPRAAVAAVVAFAHASGSTVIAEGIESELTASFMRRMGVHLGQGFHFGRPLVPAGAGLNLSVPLLRQPTGGAGLLSGGAQVA
jgi:diguanylate cyclase (GGDEF)-like protein